MTCRSRRGSEPNLLTLPVEIQDLIIQHLPQSALHALLLTNTALIELATTYLYMAPYFASTYRYAQFAYFVSHKPYYADMVRDLDLCYFQKLNLNAQGDPLPMAGWREFKYREHEDCYAKEMMTVRRRGGSVSSHPAPSPYLKSFAHTRDIPIGGLCHVLAACKRIRTLNLTRLKLASDFLLCSPSTISTRTPTTYRTYVPTATTSLLFVSDVPKSWTWRSTDLQPVYTDFVVSHIIPLDHLKELKARHNLWLNTNRVQMLVYEDGCKNLERVDFRGSGMQKDPIWAVKGSRKDVRGFLVDFWRNGGYVGRMG